MELDPEAVLKTLGRHHRRMGEMAMTKQVDNGELYLARYLSAGHPGIVSSRQRVEIRKTGAAPIANVPWDDFKEIIRLGQQLIEMCDGT